MVITHSQASKPLKIFELNRLVALFVWLLLLVGVACAQSTTENVLELRELTIRSFLEWETR